jgi:ADP-ribosylglycohydrolase
LAAPGDPDAAAAMAWRDARLSHTKNGIYAAMFQAALVASAFSEREPARQIEQALARVPSGSRLAQAVRTSLALSLEEGNWEDAWDRLMPHIGGYDPRHAIPAAALETLALLHGEGQFGRSIALAVCCGLNPAAIGAAVGTVLGVAGGVRSIPPLWAQPLNNTLRGGLPSPAQTTISDTSRRSARVLEAAIAAAKA